MQSHGQSMGPKRGRNVFYTLGSICEFLSHCSSLCLAPSSSLVQLVVYPHTLLGSSWAASVDWWRMHRRWGRDSGPFQTPLLQLSLSLLLCQFTLRLSWAANLWSLCLCWWASPAALAPLFLSVEEKIGVDFSNHLFMSDAILNHWYVITLGFIFTTASVKINLLTSPCYSDVGYSVWTTQGVTVRVVTRLCS